MRSSHALSHLSFFDAHAFCVTHTLSLPPVHLCSLMSLASGEAEDAADDVAACCLIKYDRIAPKGAKPAIRSDGRCVVVKGGGWSASLNGSLLQVRVDHPGWRCSAGSGKEPLHSTLHGSQDIALRYAPAPW